jgi:hypothetical protein
LNDLGEAIGSINQGYSYSGLAGEKKKYDVKGSNNGSSWIDHTDTCDGNECQIICNGDTVA